MSPAPRILLSCGEASGDLYAAGLLARLREHRPGLLAFGLGGDRFAAEGGVLLAHIRDLAVTGLVEVLSHLGRIRGVFRKVLEEVDSAPPEAAVLIDYPDFNLRLARELHRRKVPVIYYVSPQVWAWRKGRIRTIKETVSRMLVIFPFEEAFYRDAGVSVTFVGHPLVDLLPAPPDRRKFLAENGLDPACPLIALLPGSRRSEVAHNLPPLLGAVALLAEGRRDLQFALAAAPALDAGALSRAARGLPIRVLSGRTPGLLATASLALVASGTATVEGALLSCPMIVVYRLSPLTYALGRPFVHVPHYAMANLIAGRRIVPELIQGDFTASRVAAEARALLEDPSRLEAMRSDLGSVRQRLGGPGASDRAARAVLDCLPPGGRAG